MRIKVGPGYWHSQETFLKANKFAKQCNVAKASQLIETFRLFMTNHTFLAFSLNYYQLALCFQVLNQYDSFEINMMVLKLI